MFAKKQGDTNTEKEGQKIEQKNQENYEKISKEIQQLTDAKKGNDEIKWFDIEKVLVDSFFHYLRKPENKANAEKLYIAAIGIGIDTKDYKTHTIIDRILLELSPGAKEGNDIYDSIEAKFDSVIDKINKKDYESINTIFDENFDKRYGYYLEWIDNGWVPRDRIKSLKNACKAALEDNKDNEEIQKAIGGILYKIRNPIYSDTGMIMYNPIYGWSDEYWGQMENDPNSPNAFRLKEETIRKYFEYQLAHGTNKRGTVEEEIIYQRAGTEEYQKLMSPEAWARLLKCWSPFPTKRNSKTGAWVQINPFNTDAKIMIQDGNKWKEGNPTEKISLSWNISDFKKILETNGSRYVKDNLVDIIEKIKNYNPAVATTEAQPAVATTEAQPDVTTTEVKPDVATTEVKPAVATTEVKPAVATTEVKPAVATTEVKPAVATPEAQAAEVKEKDNTVELRNNYLNALTDYVVTKWDGDLMKEVVADIKSGNIGLLGIDKQTQTDNFNKIVRLDSFKKIRGEISQEAKDQIINAKMKIEWKSDKSISEVAKGWFKEILKQFGWFILDIVELFWGKWFLKGFCENFWMDYDAYFWDIEKLYNTKYWLSETQLNLLEKNLNDYFEGDKHKSDQSKWTDEMINREGDTKKPIKYSKKDLKASYVEIFSTGTYTNENGKDSPNFLQLDPVLVDTALKSNTDSILKISQKDNIIITEKWPDWNLVKKINPDIDKLISPAERAAILDAMITDDTREEIQKAWNAISRSNQVYNSDVKITNGMDATQQDRISKENEYAKEAKEGRWLKNADDILLYLWFYLIKWSGDLKYSISETKKSKKKQLEDNLISTEKALTIKKDILDKSNWTLKLEEGKKFKINDIAENLETAQDELKITHTAEDGTIEIKDIIKSKVTKDWKESYIYVYKENTLNEVEISNWDKLETIDGKSPFATEAQPAVVTAPTNTPTETQPAEVEPAEVASTPATTEVASTPATTEVASTPATTEAANTPATTEVANTPATTEVASTPATTEAANTPATTEAANTPATTEVANTPATTEVANTPATTEVANTPATTEASIDELERMIKPKVRERMIKPKVFDYTDQKFLEHVLKTSQRWKSLWRRQ